MQRSYRKYELEMDFDSVPGLISARPEARSPGHAPAYWRLRAWGAALVISVSSPVCGFILIEKTFLSLLAENK